MSIGALGMIRLLNGVESGAIAIIVTLLGAGLIVCCLILLVSLPWERGSKSRVVMLS